ncbi:MAG: DGQHR domain-containing protein [Pirellula sp.]|jgi:DGQHR domain-containing protein|nr:DGQHR domain-containing protein [Pirellula sp.]
MTKHAYAVSLVTQGKWRFYTLTIPSDVLAKCCFVSSRIEDPAEGFQRRLDKKRAEAIAYYVDKDLGTIPNSVILSAQKDAKLEVTGRGKTIQFEEVPKAFLVLDGQHRVYGYTLAKTSLRVPVVIYNGLTKAQEVRLFTDINTKQRPVPNELLLDIQHMAGDESQEDNLLRVVFDTLDTNRSGPLFGLLAPSERTKGKISRVTFNAAVKPHLQRFSELDEDRVGDIIGNYLSAVRQHLSARDLDATLVNPTVFRAIFDLFPRVAQRVSDLNSSNYLVENFHAVLEPVFARLQAKVLTHPGTSFKQLGDKLVSRLEKSQKF